MPIACTGAMDGSATLTVASAVAKRLKLSRTTVASSDAKCWGPHSIKVSLKPSSSLAKALARKGGPKSVKLTLVRADARLRQGAADTQEDDHAQALGPQLAGGLRAARGALSGSADGTHHRHRRKARDRGRDLPPPGRRRPRHRVLLRVRRGAGAGDGGCGAGRRACTASPCRPTWRQRTTSTPLFEAAASLGAVTGLVNNAGITGPVGKLVEVDVGEFERLFAVNVIGVLLCCRRAAQVMAPGGAIVNLSSGAATLGGPGEYVHYAASKGAVDTLTVGLSKELGADGIRVNAVAPGAIYTEIHLDPARPDRIGAQTPLGRAGEPDEVAAAVAWLLSEDASYTTGAILRVAGGR